MKDYKFIKLVKLGQGEVKKYRAVFRNRKTGREKNIKFGRAGMDDYLGHKDDERKKRFLSRFNKTIKKNINNPLSPMWWSTYLLWNETTYQASFKDIKSRLSKLGYL